MNEAVTVRSNCRLCGSKSLVLSVSLAAVPIISPNVGTALDAETARSVAPLDIYLCADCGLSQLIHVVDPALVYRRYLYRTSISAGLAEHFRGLSAAIISRLALADDARIVEFGSNDGTLLRFFKDAGMAVMGVDPAQAIAREATSRGIPTQADFFGERIATALRKEDGPAKVIIANNAIANIDDLDDVFAGVRTLLANDGVFVFETQYGPDVFEKTLLDVIYHEHISYFSVRPLAQCLDAHGLKLFNVDLIASKGGSARFWVQRAEAIRPVAPVVADLIERETTTGLYDIGYYRRFADRIAGIKARLHALIVTAKGTTGRPIAAFGASVGCAALIHQFELADKLDFLVDDTPFKDRLEGPGYDLPVLTGEAIAAQNPAAVVVLAWRYAGMIAAKHTAYTAAGGTFIVPLPDISMLP